MATNIEELHTRIEAVAPIYGITELDGVYSIQFKPEATEIEQAEANAILAAFDPVATDTSRAAVLGKIRTLAQSTVGVALADLTQAQLKALVAVLLWESGAVDLDGRIRPLREWVGE